MTVSKRLISKVRNAIEEQEKKWLQSLYTQEKKITKRFSDGINVDRPFTYTIDYFIDLKDQNTQNHNQNHKN